MEEDGRRVGKKMKIAQTKKNVLFLWNRINEMGYLIFIEKKNENKGLLTE